jgi:SAM-dependent methyltransferase
VTDFFSRFFATPTQDTEIKAEEETVVEVTDRKIELLHGLDLANLHGIEIGPLHKPIVSRTASDIKYADHADTQALRDKYAADKAVDAMAIPDIDIVMSGNNLAESAGKESMDYIIASHVIEHNPDFIGFIKDCYATLRIGGVLCLAVPDCRYTFDVFRRQTFLEDIEIAHASLATRPSLDQVVDHVKNIVDLNLRLVWEDRAHALQTARLKHARANIPRLIEMHQTGQYMDVHCWVFTPGSFLRLMKQVCATNEIAFGLRRFVSTRPLKDEFLLQLEKLPVDADRTSGWSEEVLSEE